VSYVEISTDYFFVLSQSTRLTDRRTDKQTADDSKTVCMHSQSHGKNCTHHLLQTNDAMSVTSAAVDELQRPMIVVTRDVIHFTAVVARDHNLVAMTTDPRVV